MDVSLDRQGGRKYRGKCDTLDCTLRDGGYINDWRFGEETIKGFCKKISQTGIQICEVGFIKGDNYEPERAVFPDTDSFKNVIQPKSQDMMYVGMIDMSAPVPMDCIAPCDGTSIDGIRVIFKKDKINEAYEYCEYVMKQGYFLSVNFVGTDLYTDKEFIEGIERFNVLKPDAVSIVDTFGLIKRKQFLRLVYLADNNLAEGIALAYHAHNNLQQAFGNAEALVEMNLKRDVIIDACVFGMGRGAGNLNLELFAEFMNENYDTHYKIEPMLEIMDEYLNDIYQNKFWGYSLPFYLSATTGSHPNYAIYLAEKDSLTVKGFNELLNSIPAGDKESFSKDKAEKYYREYLEHYIDDKPVIEELTAEFVNKKIIILAPGRHLKEYADDIKRTLGEPDVISIALNFKAEAFEPDYIFSSNMRRYVKIQGETDAKCIITSNMKEATSSDYIVNFASYSINNPEIVDNSGLMLLRLLIACGVKEVKIAGMDGYSGYQNSDYIDSNLEYDFSKQAERRNAFVSVELKDIEKLIHIEFITPTQYMV